MNIELWALTIKLDVLLVQIINIWILFFLFRKFAGDALAHEIQRKKTLMQKLADADKEYQMIIKKAHEEKDAILMDALTTKQKLVQEWTLLGEKKTEELLSKAQQEAQNIIKNAQSESEKLQSDLMNNRTDGVKRTTEIVVKKLLGSDQKLQDTYIEKIINDIKQSSIS